MAVTGDQFLVKEINKTVVLEAIRRHAPISRADVCKITGLNKGTVSNLVNELLDSHFVYETGPGESSGGRKPVILMFNNWAGFAIGVNLKVDLISAVLTDLQGNIIERNETPLLTNSQSDIYQKLKQSIEGLMAKTSESPYGVVGIGIGFPGTIDDEGNVLIAPTLKWKNVPLQTMLERDFSIPIIIYNEARVGAQGETEFGLGKNSANMLYISIDNGIGTGIMIDKELYKGHLGFSGEAGHTTFDINGEPCECGNVGCWQHYASVRPLLKQALLLEDMKEQLLRAGKSQPDMELLVQLAEEGHMGVRQLFSTIGTNIGIGISNLVRILNPELVIIGGLMAVAERWLIDSITETVKQRASLYYEHELEIRFSQLGSDATVLGAASLAISQLFKKTRVTVN
ncbi:ROK family transcriptional regulator [Neobacillus niacini]|uniref:ROK family transcriptional regulator n=1 Tax=Neobacillus niacini TaxID=86668 RepID=UPI0021CB7913|nr:ROK family transcriptional regulator [Neobacillus niacini]MCM3763865.1 ROK family transcriptional regulator [Neobacillus niacini]